MQTKQDEVEARKKQLLDNIENKIEQLEPLGGDIEPLIEYQKNYYCHQKK